MPRARPGNTGVSTPRVHDHNMAVDLRGVPTVLLPGTGSDDDYVYRAFATALHEVGALAIPHAPQPARLIAGYREALDEAARDRPIAVAGVSLGAAVGAAWAISHPGHVVAVLAALPAVDRLAAGRPGGTGRDAVRPRAAPRRTVRRRRADARIESAVVGRGADPVVGRSVAGSARRDDGGRAVRGADERSVGDAGGADGRRVGVRRSDPPAGGGCRVGGRRALRVAADGDARPDRRGPGRAGHRMPGGPGRRSSRRSHRAAVASPCPARCAGRRVRRAAAAPAPTAGRAACHPAAPDPASTRRRPGPQRPAIGRPSARAVAPAAACAPEAGYHRAGQRCPFKAFRASATSAPMVSRAPLATQRIIQRYPSTPMKRTAPSPTPTTSRPHGPLWMLTFGGVLAQRLGELGSHLPPQPRALRGRIGRDGEPAVGGHHPHRAGRADLVHLDLDLTGLGHRDEHRTEVQAADGRRVVVVEILDVERALDSSSPSCGTGSDPGRAAGPPSVPSWPSFDFFCLPNAIRDSHVLPKNRGHLHHGWCPPARPRRTKTPRRARAVQHAEPAIARSGRPG